MGMMRIRGQSPQPRSRRSGMVRAAAMDTSTNRSFRAASTGPIFSISPATI